MRASFVLMDKISMLLAHEFRVRREWDPRKVPIQMLKLDRHELLRSGRLSESRIGIWRSSGKIFSDTTPKTARMMGY